MLNIALEIPLPPLDFGRFVESNDACAAWIEVFHETLDRTPLASGITAFKEDDNTLTSLLHPSLKLEQLDLQTILFGLIDLSAHPVDIGIRALGPVGVELVVLSFFFLRSFAAMLTELSQEFAQNRFAIFRRLPRQDVVNDVLFTGVTTLRHRMLDVIEDVTTVAKAWRSIDFFIGIKGRNALARRGLSDGLF